MERVLLGIVAVMAIVILGLFLDITRLEGKLASTQAELVVSETNRYTLQNALDKQNEAIQILAVDKATRDKEYQELLTKPAEIRFKTVYSKIPNIKVESDECKDIKDMLDNIRNAGY